MNQAVNDPINYPVVPHQAQYFACSIIIAENQSKHVINNSIEFKFNVASSCQINTLVVIEIHRKLYYDGVVFQQDGIFGNALHNRHSDSSTVHFNLKERFKS